MNQHQRKKAVPAPCIIDRGILVNKEDIKRLLSDLGHVRYIHTIDLQVHSEGQGWVMEIFSDPQQSTLIANKNLYLNVQSFDYLQLGKSPENETYFDLIQDNRRLRLIPITQVSSEQIFHKNLDAEAMEAMMTEVLSARLDMQFDDEEF